MMPDTVAARLPAPLIQRCVADALSEDLGLAGDITSNATVPATAEAAAEIVARKPGIVAGLDVARAAFLALDPEAEFQPIVQDGDGVAGGAAMARVSGKARALLGAERVALNYLGRMSGIATLTRAYVDAIAGTGAKVVDTRKTTPGLRALEKYAVRCGGGQNHRTGLFDAVLIKDNHIVAAGGIARAIERARAHVGHMVKVEVEVDTIEQLEEALRHDVDAVLLDNMNEAQLRRCVGLVAGRVVTEASGGISIANARAIAATGVDLISVGALTHSAPVLDIGLDFQSPTAAARR